MRPSVPPALSLLAVAAVLTLAGCGTDTAAGKTGDGGPITLATTPLGDDPTAENPIDAFADLLSKETGREVKVTDVPDYSAAIEAVRAGHVDFTLMSGFPSALAVNTGKVDTLAAWPGTDEPVSTCVVLKDSPVKKPTDLRGKTVAFADQASSSGYFMPVDMLNEAGLQRDKDYKATFAGGHEGSFAALKQKQVDAACTASLLTQQPGSDLFPFKKGEFRTVGASKPMAVSMAAIAPEGLDGKTRKQLVKALPEVMSEKNAERLGALGAGAATEPLIEPKPDIFKPLVDVAAVADVDISDLR